MRWQSLTLPILTILGGWYGKPADSAPSQDLVFPLPPREVRIEAEARNEQTPISRLVELLGENSNEVRLNAVRLLGKSGDSAALQALQKMRVDDGVRAAVHVAVAWAPVRHQPETVQAQQISTFLDGNHTADETEAIRALQTLKCKTARDAVYDFDARHPGALTLLALAKMGDDRVLRRIEEIFAEEAARPRLIIDPPPPVEHAGGFSDDGLVELGTMYWRIRLGNSTPEARAEALIESQTTRPDLPIDGLEEIIAEAGLPVAPLMFKIVEDRKQPQFMREEAIWALLQIREPILVPKLLKLMDDPTEEPSLRGIILRQLAIEGHSEAINEILDTLKAVPTHFDKKTTSALWDVTELAKAGVDRGRLEEAILPYLQRGDDLAAMAAREVGGDACVDPLIDMVNNPPGPTSYFGKDFFRCLAITSLGFVGQRTARQRDRVLLFLVGEAHSTDYSTRNVAIQALARAGGVTGIPVLASIAEKEKDSTARWFELSGIYLAGGPVAVQALSALRQQALDKGDVGMKEICDEGLVRLKQEKRAGD